MLVRVKDGYDNVFRSFELACSMGQIPGYSRIDKFGENPSVDTGTEPEDIWEGGGLYVYDAIGTAPIISLASDANDIVPIKIVGLDIDGNEVEQIITLTGTVPIPLQTPLWRVYRMENEGTISIVGSVFCYTGNGPVPAIGDAEIRAIIDNGNNQSLMALYTLPRGFVGYLHKGEIGMSRSQTAGYARCAYYSRRFGKIFKVKKRVDITNQGTSIYQDIRSFPDIIPSLTDIRLTVEEVSANGIGFFGTIDILLVPETELPHAYLVAIGQPGYEA